MKWIYDKITKDYKTNEYRRGKCLVIYKSYNGYQLGWFNRRGVIWSPLAVEIKSLKMAKQIAQLYKEAK